MKNRPDTLLFLIVIIGVSSTVSCDRDGGDSLGDAESESQDDNSNSGNSNSDQGVIATTTTVADPSDWCRGHGVPESMCTQCNPGLTSSYQESGDWCAGHGFPESVCPVCNPVRPPEGALRPQGHGRAEAEPESHEGRGYSEYGAVGTTTTVADPSDWCNEHGVPESMCTQCNPGLASGYQESGDWCGGHGFPDSVCPLCNPVTPPEGASGPQTRVELTEAAMVTSEILVAQVSASTSTQTAVDIPAEIQFDPDRLAHINTLVDGQVVSINVTVGDRVTTGDELATFRSVDLGQARAELTRATAVREAAQQTLERQQRLRDEGISSERSLLEAQLAYEEADAARDAARSRLRVFGVRGGSGSDLVLTSPIDGVVVERHATRGENVSTEDTLFVVADTSEVWVVGRLYEQHIMRVSAGMDATLTASAFPGSEWVGVVEYIAIAMDETSRTLPVRVSVSNPDGMLRPGMFGTLAIGRGSGGSSFTVPISAVQTLDNRDVIFTAGVQERTFEAKPVVLGRESDGLVAVLDGLSDSDQIVVQGGFILMSELIRGQLGHGCAGE